MKKGIFITNSCFGFMLWVCQDLYGVCPNNECFGCVGTSTGYVHMKMGVLALCRF
jgi:hypothetical protein